MAKKFDSAVAFAGENFSRALPFAIAFFAFDVLNTFFLKQLLGNSAFRFIFFSKEYYNLAAYLALFILGVAVYFMLFKKEKISRQFIFSMAGFNLLIAFIISLPESILSLYVSISNAFSFEAKKVFFDWVVSLLPFILFLTIAFAFFISIGSIIAYLLKRELDSMDKKR